MPFTIFPLQDNMRFFKLAIDSWEKKLDYRGTWLRLGFLLIYFLKIILGQINIISAPSLIRKSNLSGFSLIK